MIGPLLRALISMYGPTIAKTVISAVKKTLDSNFYSEAGHDPIRDFQELLTKGQQATARRMTVEEAKNVLNVQKLSKEEVNRQFEKLYLLNDPTKGGSFYLQCKLMGAKDILLENTKK